MSAPTIPHPTPPDPPLLKDERTAAIILGISPRTLWSLAARKEISCVRIGRRKLYSVSALHEFIRQREAADITADS